jgi:hypothetical protein
MMISCPCDKKVGSTDGLAVMISSTVTLKREAINDNVSPGCTIYTGPLVCADTDVIKIEATSINKRETEISLRILEFHRIANLEFLPALGMDFQNISGGLLGEIGWSPRFRKYFIHHLHFRVDPDDSKVKGYEEHMDGGLEARIAPPNQNQAFIPSE